MGKIPSDEPASSSSDDTNVPIIHISISLTPRTFRQSDLYPKRPVLEVTSTLQSPAILTVNGHGERYAGTILGTMGMPFRLENFDFYDLTTSEPVIQDLYPGSCLPGVQDYIELRSSKPHVVRNMLDKDDPFSDPVNILKVGHSYRITLRPQTIKCWAGSIKRSEHFPEEEQPPGAMMVTLACDDELVLDVEA